MGRVYSVLSAKRLPDTATCPPPHRSQHCKQARSRTGDPHLSVLRGAQDLEERRYAFCRLVELLVQDLGSLWVLLLLTLVCRRVDRWQRGSRTEAGGRVGFIVDEVVSLGRHE